MRCDETREAVQQTAKHRTAVIIGNYPTQISIVVRVRNTILNKQFSNINVHMNH